MIQEDPSGGYSVIQVRDDGSSTEQEVAVGMMRNGLILDVL